MVCEELKYLMYCYMKMIWIIYFDEEFKDAVCIGIKRFLPDIK